MDALKQSKTKIRKKYSQSDNVFSLIIVLLPFLHQYRGIGTVVSFGELLLIPFVTIYGLKIVKNKTITPNKPLLMLYLFSLLGILVNAGFSFFEFSSAVTIAIRLVFYGIIVYSARSHFNLKAVVKVYFFAATAASIYLIIQYGVYHSVGKILPLYINYSWLFPPEAREASFSSFYDQYKTFRASSFFLEPGYYALFCIPHVCMLLLKSNKDIIDKVSITVAFVGMVLSESMAGLGALMIFLGFFLFNQRNNKNKVLKGTVVFLIVAIFGMIIMSESSSLGFLSRFKTGGSFNYRITRGLLIYNELPIFHKIFGVGLNNIQPYMLLHNMRTPYDEANLNACCTVFQTLNFSGIFALISLLLFVRAEYKKSTGTIERALVFAMLFIMCYESILFSYRFTFLSIMIMGIRNVENEECLL